MQVATAETWRDVLYSHAMQGPESKLLCAVIGRAMNDAQRAMRRGGFGRDWVKAGQ